MCIRLQGFLLTCYKAILIVKNIVFFTEYVNNFWNYLGINLRYKSKNLTYLLKISAVADDET